MPTTHKRSRQKKIDPLNIVPPKGKKIQIGSAAAPKLVYNGGPLLSSVEVCPVFWGDVWAQPAERIISQYLYLFFESVLTSSFMTQLSEYNVPSYPIEFGSVTDIITIPHKFTIDLVLDVVIRNMLRKQIASGTLPPINPNRLYFVYLPPGVTVQKGVGLSCLTFCGYHDAIANSIFYAVVPYPSCTSCLNGLSVNDALTSISSHELAEAITDPVPGKGWYDNTNGEIGDICAWKTTKLPNTNYLIQQEWSNQLNACSI